MGSITMSEYPSNSHDQGAAPRVPTQPLQPGQLSPEAVQGEGTIPPANAPVPQSQPDAETYPSAESPQAQPNPFAAPAPPPPAAPGFSPVNPAGQGVPAGQAQAYGAPVAPGSQPGLPPQPVALSYPLPPAGPAPSPARFIWLLAVILEVVIILVLLLGVIGVSVRNARLEQDLEIIQMTNEQLQREVEELQR